MEEVVSSIEIPHVLVDIPGQYIEAYVHSS